MHIPRAKKKSLSFARELWISTGSKSDWPYFARWHYRSRKTGFVRFVTLLWHGDLPIGICLFTTPPKSLAMRNRFFGHSGRWSRLSLKALNQQVMLLSRIVLHPTYRGCGLATTFLRESCRHCPAPWIETLAEMGHMNPLFEKAGFQRVGTTPAHQNSYQQHQTLFTTRSKLHGQKTRLSQETHHKSRFAQPIYYIFDNRANHNTNREKESDTPNHS